jgi:hypothetical protein
LKEEKRDEGLVTLADGSVEGAASAAMCYDSMRSLAPEFFRSLVALVQGRRKDADRRHFRDLVGAGMIEDNTSVPPDVRRLVLNSLVETAAGPELGELRFKSEADRERFAVEWARWQEEHNVARAYRHYHGRFPPSPWEKGKGDGPGR